MISLIVLLSPNSPNSNPQLRRQEEWERRFRTSDSFHSFHGFHGLPGFPVTKLKVKVAYVLGSEAAPAKDGRLSLFKHVNGRDGLPHVGWGSDREERGPLPRRRRRGLALQERQRHPRRDSQARGGPQPSHLPIRSRQADALWLPQVEGVDRRKGRQGQGRGSSRAEGCGEPPGTSGTPFGTASARRLPGRTPTPPAQCTACRGAPVASSGKTRSLLPFCGRRGGGTTRPFPGHRARAPRRAPRFQQRCGLAVALPSQISAPN